MPTTTKYTHFLNGKQVYGQHTECDPEFQKFTINPIDTGETSVMEYPENEYEPTPEYKNPVSSLSKWRFAIIALIAIFVFVITIFTMVLK